MRLTELLTKLAYDPTRWTEDDSRELLWELGLGYSDGANIGHLSEAIRAVVRGQKRLSESAFGIAGTCLMCGALVPVIEEGEKR